MGVIIKKFTNDTKFVIGIDRWEETYLTSRHHWNGWEFTEIANKIHFREVCDKVFVNGNKGKECMINGKILTSVEKQRDFEVHAHK